MSAIDDEFTVQLITYVSRHSELYDLSHENYGSQRKKDKIWRQIASKLHVEPDRCKNKWKNLRDAFLRVVKSIKSKNGLATKSTRRWRFYEPMSFLLPHLKCRPDTSNIDQEPEDTTDINDPLQYDDNSSARYQDELHSLVNKYGSPASTTSSSTHSIAKSNKRKLSSEQEENQEDTEQYKLFRQFLAEQKSQIDKRTKDHLEEFFTYISRTVKTFPPVWQTQIKRKVFEIVNSTEAMLLSANDSSLPASSSSEFLHSQSVVQPPNGNWPPPPSPRIHSAQQVFPASLTEDNKSSAATSSCSIFNINSDKE